MIDREALPKSGCTVSDGHGAAFCFFNASKSNQLSKRLYVFIGWYAVLHV